MATGGAHPELIESGFFNEKFKNNLRDFFVYGFKASDPKGNSDFKKRGSNQSRPANTFSDERSRLQLLLERQSGVTWEKQQKKVYCVTTDSRSIEENPFFSLYRCCMDSPDEILWALTVLMALHPHVESKQLPSSMLRELCERILNLADDVTAGEWNSLSKTDRKTVGQEILGELSEEDHLLLSLYGKEIDPSTLTLAALPDQDIRLTTKELQLFCDLHNCREVTSKQFNARMRDLASIGLVEEVRPEGSRLIRWRLSDRFLPKKWEGDLEERFALMVSFFAETLPLGTVGYLLKDRFAPASALFSYKHSYIARALNDYNLADILVAIREKKWLKISYRNGLDLVCREMLCLPLALRESSYSGRQYLVGYHPALRSISALRLDFIDDILFGELPGFTVPESDLLHAKELINNCWGSSFPDFLNGNVIEAPKFYRLKAVFRWDPVTEGYIKTRLNREKRFGVLYEEENTLVYEVTVTDPGELKPWLRSYFSRLISVTVNGKDWGNFESDVSQALFPFAEADRISVHIATLTPARDLPDLSALSFREDAEILPHNGLFHPIFGHCCRMAGRLLFAICKEGTLSDKVAETLLINEMAASGLPEDSLVFDAVMEVLQSVCNYSYKTKTYTAPFAFAAGESFLSHLPLSRLEASWLKTTLLHPKAKLFLREEEIETLLSCCGEEEALPLDAVELFDAATDLEEQYDSPKTRGIFSEILTALLQKRELMVSYRTQNDTMLDTVCCPLKLEYSRREDKMRLYACDLTAGKEHRILALNLERFASSAALEETNADAYETFYTAYRAEQRRQLTLEFKNFHSVPDRLLNEFSPWEKRCTLDRTTGIYTTVMEYDDSDAFELAIRLLSYGPNIKVVSDSGSAAENYRHRLQRQKELYETLAEK